MLLEHKNAVIDAFGGSIRADLGARARLEALAAIWARQTGRSIVVAP